MFSRVIASSALLIPLLLSAEPASAQRVSADIRIGGGPIAGHIRIGSGGYRERPRFVRVEVLRGRDFYRRSGWFRSFRRDARVIVVYYDRERNFYYDRFRPGFIRMNVYERGGRFYRWDDDRFDRWVGDRWNDDRRWDDRYDGDDRYDRRDNRSDRRDDRFDRRDNRDDRRDDRRDRGGRPGQ